MNQRTGETYRKTDDGWDADPWWDLPDMVKEAVRRVLNR